MVALVVSGLILAASRFLLISLGMDAVHAGATIHQRRQALHRVANGLGFQDAYSTTLGRIREQGGSRSKLRMDALMWLPAASSLCGWRSWAMH